MDEIKVVAELIEIGGPMDEPRAVFEIDGGRVLDLPVTTQQAADLAPYLYHEHVLTIAVRRVGE